MSLMPSAAEWSAFGISVGEEFHAGKQSRVFAAEMGDRKIVVKLTDPRFGDVAELRARVAVVESLAELHAAVVVPQRIDGELVQTIGDWWLTATPFVAGRRLDSSDTADSHRMGEALALLHDVLALLPACDLPVVSALASAGDDADRSGWQLVHGDFSDQNLITVSQELRILDFDDCGYGPPLYDVANSLYMVLFDSTVNDHLARYRSFRESFLGGYVDASERSVDDGEIEELITARVAALGRWLDDLAIAPVGIRTSSPAWKETLRAFVDSYANL